MSALVSTLERRRGVARQIRRRECLGQGKDGSKEEKTEVEELHDVRM